MRFKGINFQTSVCHSNPEGDVEIRKAQSSIAKAYEDILMVMNTDELGGEYRFDECHFNFDGAEILKK